MRVSRASIWQKKQLAFALGVGPVAQQGRRGGGHADVAPFPPHADALADAVDGLVLLDPVLGPFGVKRGLFFLLFRASDRNEVGARSPARDNFVSDPLVSKFEMPIWARGTEN